MSDFIAHVIAELDTAKAQQQMNAFTNAKHKIDVDVNLVSKNGNINGYLNQIKSQFGQAGNVAGNNFARNANASLNSIDLSRTKTEIKNLQNSLQNFGFNKSSLSNITKELDNLKVTVTGISHELNGDRLNVTVTGVDDLGRAVTAMQSFSAQTGDLINTSSRVRESFRQMFTGADVSKLNSDIASLNAGFVKLKGDTNSYSAELSKLNSDIASLNAGFVKLKGDTNSYSAELSKLKSELAGIGNISGLDKQQAEFDRITQEVGKLKLAYKEAKAENDSFAASQQLLSQRTVLGNQIETWMNKNTIAARKYKNELKDIQTALANATTGSALKDVNRQFTELKTTAAASGSLGKGVFATLKDNMTSLSPLFGMGDMINTAIRGLKDMYSNVVNIDSAMTELKKVTDETDSAYSSFLTNASKRSVELGTTITDYVNSTANFVRLGYSMADATQLSEVANIYSVVGDEISGIDEASSSVISTMQAFGIQANDAISIVDKFNEVGNRFAISSGGIGDALTRSASSMAAANNTLDETIALITAANTVVQDAPRVGNAFKTISMRIRGATTELEEAGLETDGMAESTAKLQAEIKALSGVDIMLDKNTFKSTYQIMDELSQKWKDLTDIQQASITELLAGKHQGNVMASLMENFDIARQALDVSMNSEGSAMQEHEKYMDSIEARVNQLKAAWEGLSNSFLDSGFVKGAVSGLTEIAEAITTVIDHIGTLGTIGAGVGIVALIKNFGKEFALYGCESIDA